MLMFLITRHFGAKLTVVELFSHWLMPSGLLLLQPIFLYFYIFIFTLFSTHGQQKAIIW